MLYKKTKLYVLNTGDFKFRTEIQSTFALYFGMEGGNDRYLKISVVLKQDLFLAIDRSVIHNRRSLKSL